MQLFTDAERWQWHRRPPDRGGRRPVAHEELIDLEQQGWQALMATPAAARKFYENVFDERKVVLLSDLPPIRTRDEALDALCGPV
ncbi:hypothetical protein [Amycolatopsis eburnea]|uniref:Uncharacterized protein n=1 Tax=Amycolatopsis eburnea TaxID=2267691 RepID=A0A3R9DG04_9PSEU|nr:hypothetical protein [Amycolatopsis eburnea]RSD13574.1 hypothetical protein EIY87_28100 [Amycolatopsis eburnea]